MDNPLPFRTYENSKFKFALLKAPRWAADEPQGGVIEFSSPHQTFMVWVVVIPNFPGQADPWKYVQAIGGMRTHPVIGSDTAGSLGWAIDRGSPSLDRSFNSLAVRYEYIRAETIWTGLVYVYTNSGALAYWVWVEAPMNGWDYYSASEVARSLVAFPLVTPTPTPALPILGK